MARQSTLTRGVIATLLCVALLTLTLFVARGPVRAQEPSQPLSFGDPASVTVIWPAPVRLTLHNNTTSRLVAMVQVTNLVDTTTETALLPDEIWDSIPPYLVFNPAGQSDLTLGLKVESRPRPGTYTGSIVFSESAHNVVLRKSVTLMVPEDPIEPLPVPAVDTWTLNALRVFPFTNPICLRGLSVGCTLPVEDAGSPHLTPALLGYLGNERGGGLAIRLTGTSAAAPATRRGAPAVSAAPSTGAALSAPAEPAVPAATSNAWLSLAFVDDQGAIPRWGLTGIYRGRLRFEPGNGTASDTAGAADARTVDLTVTVKDIVLWPILVLLLGIWTAREVQRYLTVRRDLDDLLGRLDAVSKQFDELRASVYGYSVTEDVAVRRQELEARIKAWNHTHYGPPTPAEQERLTRTILEPLATLESHVAVWATFRDKLDRLRRKMEYAAKPAIQQAEIPSGLLVEIQNSGLPSHPEPRFYTVARSLLQGGPMELALVPGLARRIDQAADIAAVWGEYDQMVTLVRDGLRQLYNPTVELSLSEEELLDRARQHLNSAARDLWEARDLQELRERETQAELAESRDIVQRLLDPFVYQGGLDVAPRTVPAPVAPRAGAGAPPAEAHTAFAPDDGTALLDSYPAPVVAFLQPMVRSYARLSDYHLPGLEGSRPATRTPGAPLTTAGSAPRIALVGERTVAWAALVTALVAGLNHYATTQFGAFADYLTLFTWAFAIKAGLELANVLLSPRRD